MAKERAWVEPRDEEPAEAPQDTGKNDPDRDPADIAEAVQKHRAKLEEMDRIRGW